MATSLDSDAFLNAFVRMTARNGWPQQMQTDNGTNFVSSSKDLNDVVSTTDHDKIQRSGPHQPCRISVESFNQ